MFENMLVLLVEDDDAVRIAAAQTLELAGFRVQTLGAAEPVCGIVREDFPGIVVSDVRLPGMSGLELLHFCRENAPDVPVILITGHGDISMAVKAIHDGAYDFMEKPFSVERLVEAATRAMEKRKLVLENLGLRRELAGRQPLDSRIIGHAPSMQEVRRLIDGIGPSDAPVLIVGETGTGKELVARSLHDRSARRDRPFAAINCGAMPEALFESEMFGAEAGAFTGASKRRIGHLEYAHGGTLFLDEIESMPLPVQVKLLRALQEGAIERLGSNRPVPVDLRIVAAAKGDLLALGNEGKFRSDLYYRLNVVRIDLPSLRARREDVPLLFEHFAHEAAIRYGRPAPLPSQALLHRLLSHDWPGNVRELRNAAERFVLGIPDELVLVQEETAIPTELPRRMENVERAMILFELRRCAGQIARAAQALGIPKTTLYDKIRKYRLNREIHCDADDQPS